MPDSRDLIVGVLAAQAGFVTPEQVLRAAAAGLVDGQEGTILTWLERHGALSAERRRIVEALADEAIRARSGDARAVAASLGAAGKLLETLASGTPPMAPAPSSATGLPRGGQAEVPLERAGQYTRLHELGRGSQSVVRAARDEIVGREVALKELAPVGATGSTDATRAAQARFLREVRLIAGLDHPGIVAVLELAHREDGTLFCAEKLIRGRTLQASLALCQSLADRLRLLRHVVDACQAIAYAHAKRIVHRDLKPSNVMVGEYGETVVVDWGLAKRREEKDEVVPLASAIADPLLTVAGIALGTPAYMSPEQARGDVAAIDARSDVFSLGAILYQVLTGRPPFEGANAEHIMEKVRLGRFAKVLALSPEAPPELAAIAERALSFQPAERYEDAAALAKELSTFLAGGKVGAYRYGAWELVKKFAATHRTLTTSLAVAIGALVMSAAVVAFRLHATRVALASSLAERAYSSETEGDWAQAAAYFAAAREQHDTSEARWGVGLAAERATERILAKHGPAGSFTDVGVLPDGRAIALGQMGNVIEVREVESGTKLWSLDTERVFAAVLLPTGHLRLTVKEGWAFYDAATGDRLALLDRNSVGRPCPATYPAPVVALRGKLFFRAEGAPPRILANDVSADERCFVSRDYRRAAYVDVSENIQLIDVEDGRRIASRPASGLRGMFFTAHGLVIAKLGRIEVVGGPQGDFTIELPESGFGETQTKVGGDAVSPDGHLVVLARLGSNRADVIDFRTRSIRGTLHYAAGWPRLAFSRDGQEIFAAGIQSGSTLDGWRLPTDEMPTKHPGAWRFLSVNFSTTGHRFLIVDTSRRRYELYGAGDELIGSGAVSDELHSVFLSGDGTAVLLVDEGGKPRPPRIREWSRRLEAALPPLSSGRDDGRRIARRRDRGGRARGLGHAGRSGRLHRDGATRRLRHLRRPIARRQPRGLGAERDRHRARPHVRRRADLEDRGRRRPRLLVQPRFDSHRLGLPRPDRALGRLDGAVDLERPPQDPVAERFPLVFRRTRAPPSIRDARDRAPRRRERRKASALLRRRHRVAGGGLRPARPAAEAGHDRHELGLPPAAATGHRKARFHARANARSNRARAPGRRARGGALGRLRPKPQLNEGELELGPEGLRVEAIALHPAHHLGPALPDRSRDRAQVPAVLAEERDELAAGAAAHRR